MTLRIGIAGDPATLDPVQSVSFVDRVALIAICDKLVDVDNKLAVVPQLATAWNWSASDFCRVASRMTWAKPMTVSPSRIAVMVMLAQKRVPPR